MRLFLRLIDRINSLSPSLSGSDYLREAFTHLTEAAMTPVFENPPINFPDFIQVNEVEKNNRRVKIEMAVACLLKLLEDETQCPVL